MQPPTRRHLEAVIRDKDGNHIARCLIQRGRYIIGHDFTNEIVVDEPSVSSKHARLTVASEVEFFIEDLDSANGTRVNGQHTQGSVPVELQSKVELGLTTLEFQRGGLPASVFDSLPDGFLRKNRYNIGDIVVQGRTSTIYEAYDTSLGRHVAIKAMRAESQAIPENVLRFVREAQISSQLQHQGVLPIYELNLDDQSQLFYTTRFVEGSSLSSILSDLTQLPPEQEPEYTLAPLLEIFQRVCDVVAFAHSRGVIHGGLRPDTITVGTFGEVFVANWGLAKVHHLDAKNQPLTTPLRVAESAMFPALSGFSAPEQAAEVTDEINARSDIYALGAILFQILTLNPPIEAEDHTALLDLVLTGTIRSLSTLSKETQRHCPGNHFPEPLAALAMRALSHDAADRPETVPQLQEDLAALVATHLQTGNGLWKRFNGLLKK